LYDPNSGPIVGCVFISASRCMSNVSPGSATSLRNGTSVPALIVDLHKYPRSWLLLSYPCSSTFILLPDPRRSPPNVTLFGILFFVLFFRRVSGGCASRCFLFFVFFVFSFIYLFSFLFIFLLFRDSLLSRFVFCVCIGRCAAPLYLAVVALILFCATVIFSRVARPYLYFVFCILYCERSEPIFFTARCLFGRFYFLFVSFWLYFMSV
jgi:hypothetical protein